MHARSIARDPLVLIDAVTAKGRILRPSLQLVETGGNGTVPDSPVAALLLRRP
jgi:hypothetical protein